MNAYVGQIGRQFLDVLLQLISRLQTVLEKTKDKKTMRSSIEEHRRA